MSSRPTCNDSSCVLNKRKQCYYLSFTILRDGKSAKVWQESNWILFCFYLPPGELTRWMLIHLLLSEGESVKSVPGGIARDGDKRMCRSSIFFRAGKVGLRGRKLKAEAVRALVRS